MKKSVFAIVLFALCASSFALSAASLRGRVSDRSLVYDRNQEGSKFYRIPAVVTAADGTLISVADKRIDDNSDLPGRIDVVCRTSSDNGRSWGPQITVAAHDEGGGYGDPALVIDRKSGDVICIMTHGQGLWTATDGDGARIMVCRSSDNGATWSAPVDISSSLYSGTAGTGPVKAVSVFATSGRAVQLRDGRIMFALVVRPEEKMWGDLYINAVYSDDGGYTWAINPVPVDTDADESKIVELPDRSLIMSIRNRRKGLRKFARSTDRGASWSEVTYVNDLIEPGCNGDIIEYNRDGKDYLLHSLPRNPKDRTDVTVMASSDGGYSWSEVVNVCPTESAYSSLTVLPDGSVGCLTEEGCSDGGYRLWFSKIDVWEE